MIIEANQPHKGNNKLYHQTYRTVHKSFINGSVNAFMYYYHHIYTYEQNKEKYTMKIR